MPERDRLRATLKKTGIETGFQCPLPLHKQLAYSGSDHTSEDFPVNSGLSGTMLSLPLSTGISRTEIGRGVDAPPGALELIHPEASVTWG